MSDQSTEEGSGILEKESEKEEKKKEIKSEKKPEKLKKKALKSENDKLHEKLDHLDKLFQKQDKELTEQISKFAFLQAELENTRKHYIKRQEITRNQTKANVITSFTPLIDSFEMAFKNHQKIIDDVHTPQLKQYLQGFEGIHNQLLDIFEGYKVSPIEAVQVPLDYKIHDAVLRVINDDIPDETVLQIVQKGYRMDGEVIRPAKVIVSKVTPPPAPEPVKETKPETAEPKSDSTPTNPSEEDKERNQDIQEKITPESPAPSKKV
ncbi:MAG: nucleotide exchange factor GrpE [Promethearchaeota archaeon]